MDYELSTLGDSIFIRIPRYNFHEKVTHSPNGRYFVAAQNKLLALFNVDNNDSMLVQELSFGIAGDKLVVTDHPLIAAVSDVSIRPVRQNDIYLLNHRSDILFKASVDANVYKLAISENGKYVAAQTLDNKIRLFSVGDQREITSWKTPKKAAIELSIDLINNEVRMLDYQNHVYSYQFNPL